MSRPIDPPRDAALRAADDVADTFLVGRHIPGIAYGVVYDGALIHHRGIGTLRVGAEAPPGPESVFRIASMTKSFTAATILLLRDEGSLALDDPVARHVPDLVDLRGPTADSPTITIRHLLTMTAGLPTDDPWGDRQQGLEFDRFAAFLRAGPSFAWTPGLRFEYSNLGYGILGRVITNATGLEYKDVIGSRMLEPLGMTATTYEIADIDSDRLAAGHLWRDDAYEVEPVDPYGALASMGGVYSSVGDLARWVGGFTDAFPPRDDREGAHPLRRSSRREMQQIQFVLPPEVASAPPHDPAPGATSGYGFGLFIVDDVRSGRIVGHSGGYPGFGSTMRWQPASGLGVIVLANHRYAPATALGTAILRSLMAAEPPIAAPRRLGAAAATMTARGVVQHLLDAWDDALAAASFAMTVELDEPLARRRAEIERLRIVHGSLRPDPAVATISESPMHLAWWMLGERGRVRAEILLSPESPPRIQQLTLTSVPDPAAELASAAARIVAAIDLDEPQEFADLPFGPDVDPELVARSIRAASARFGRVSLGPATASAPTSATWIVVGDRGDLTLRLERDAESGQLRAVELMSRERLAPDHAD